MEPFLRITASHAHVLDYPATHRILKNLKTYGLLPTQVVELSDVEIVSSEDLKNEIILQSLDAPRPWNHPVALGKRILHLTEYKGQAAKPCPGSQNVACCHYHIVNTISNCPYDCSYCYLQTYLNQPALSIYVNEEMIFSQVRSMCESQANYKTAESPLRVGTGELSDSLALDPITEFSAGLARTIDGMPHVRLELKTKSKNVEHLANITNKSQIVISWSMNAPIISTQEEHKTASFEQRIQAAQWSAHQGFGVGFHFDPLIAIENWKTVYTQSLDEILEKIPSTSLRWISFGSLRVQPELRAGLLQRRPETSIFHYETVPGQDGKQRVMRSIRTEMYSYLENYLKSQAPHLHTYLCMETLPVWQKAMGRLPDRSF